MINWHCIWRERHFDHFFIPICSLQCNSLFHSMVKRWISRETNRNSENHRNRFDLELNMQSLFHLIDSEYDENFKENEPILRMIFLGFEELKCKLMLKRYQVYNETNVYTREKEKTFFSFFVIQFYYFAFFCYFFVLERNVKE